MSVDRKAFGISDSLVNAVNEALKGGQVKLDKNHNGKLDAQDFKMLRKEDAGKDVTNPKQGSSVNPKQREIDEGNPMNKEKKNAAVAAVGAKNRDSQYLDRMNPAVADKIRGREKMSGKDRQQHEEVEQVDELSGSLAHRAAHGAWIKTDKAKAAFKGQAKAAAQARKFGQYAAKKGYYDAPKKTNEEAQQVDELSTDTYHSAAKKAAKKAMGDAQGRSGPIFKKYAGMANKFRDKGMSQEKKEKAMKEDIEQVDEISKKLAARYNNKVGREINKNQPSDPNEFRKRKNREAGYKLSSNKYHGYKVKVPATNEETDPGFTTEANDMSKQIAAKKDQFKSQLQQKIAAKQMNTMQAKANKRLSNIHASNDKCTCQEGKGKSMSCEMHGDKSKGIKGGKEPIEVNPPMREAAELPKKVVTKGHEIAKSLIKHRSKVDNPYAVGMAAAKKSAKMNAYRADRNKHGED
jgi:hypothetical protein